MGCDGCGFEIGDGAGGVGDVVAECVTDGFPGRSISLQVSDDGANFFDRVLAFHHEEENTGATAVWGWAEVGEDVVTDALLRGAVGGILRGDDVRSVGVDEFFTGGEQSRFDEVEGGAGDEAGDDATGARFPDGVRGDEYVREFF